MPEPRTALRGAGRCAALLLAALAMASCTTPAPHGDAGTANIQLLAFNDFHGHLQPPGTPTRLPAADGGAEQLLPTGGVAWLAGRIAELKRDNPATVVVAAGDLIGGSPLISSLLKHESSIHALGDAGLEFSSAGNHEFDRGVGELLRLQSLGRFRYLAANVRYRRDGRPPFPAWAEKRITLPGGRQLRMAFIGAVLRETPTLVNADGVADVEFLDEVETVNAAAREIRAAGIETIVLLIHQGGFTDQARFDDLTCPGFRGPILDIVEHLDPAIDLIVSGHTHRAYVCRHHGRLVTSGGLEGRFLTDIDLTVDLASGDVRNAQARQLAVVNDTRPNPLSAQFPTTVPDQKLLARVAGWAKSVAPLASREVGSVAAPLTRRPDANGETALGDTVADGQLAATSAPGDGGAQMAIINNGGLRNDLAPADGRVTYEQAFGVHPFGNHLVTLSLTGAEIDAFLETQWQGAGSLLQVSSGLKFRWSASGPPGQRIAPGDILLDGKPLQPDALYRVTVTDFLANGGDGYVVLKNGRDRVVGMLDVEALERYLGRQSPLAVPTSGRIAKLP